MQCTTRTLFQMDLHVCSIMAQRPDGQAHKGKPVSHPSSSFPPLPNIPPPFLTYLDITASPSIVYGTRSIIKHAHASLNISSFPPSSALEQYPRCTCSSRSHVRRRGRRHQRHACESRESTMGSTCRSYLSYHEMKDSSRLHDT